MKLATRKIQPKTLEFSYKRTCILYTVFPCGNVDPQIIVDKIIYLREENYLAHNRIQRHLVSKTLHQFLIKVLVRLPHLIPHFDSNELLITE
jgi:hypothetical protein